MKFKRIIALLLSCVLTFGLGAYAEEQKTSEAYDAFERIADYASQLYIDETLTKEEIMQRGMSKFLEDNPDILIELLKDTLESLDEYSTFYTAEEYQEYTNTLNKMFYGIGITMQKNGEFVEITGYAAKSNNAKNAGFLIGDKIYAVDGVECSEKSIEDVRNMIVGELNTIVEITVLRGDELVNINVTRVAVRDDTVTGGIFAGNIGYAKISTFGEKTSEEFAERLADFRSKGVEKIILDLRNNGGGMVSSAVEVAKQIVPRGKIVELICRNEKANVIYRSELAKAEFDILVLVNEYTASSSEILASAVQDSNAGKLIGTNTYGKAVVQQLFPLINGMNFKLTIGEYVTRNGKKINAVGLAPDEYVENTTEKIDSMKYNRFDFTNCYALGDSNSRVIAAKERLAMLGYFGDKTDDSIFSEALRNSIINFQNDNLLCASGVLDIPTQVKIEEMFRKLEITVDLQLRYAYEMFGGNPEDLYAE